MTRPNPCPFDPRNPPEHIYRVPAYHRRHFGPSDFPEELPSVTGPKVRIGAAYQPAIRIAPAIHTPESHWESASFWEQATWFLALGAGFVAFVGLAYLLFGV